jgi:hypothetical protein
MRNVEAAGGIAVALVLVAGAANAQSQPPGKYKPQPLILQRQQLGTEAYAGVGRTRMRNGDCAGANEAFDAALRTSTDPTIYRDRGLCHERLGEPYPAIDDYRYYLTASPDAPDAESIRGRLANLEQATSGHSSASSDTPDDGSTAGASATVSVDGGGVHAGATTASGKPHDKMDYVEHDDDTLHTSLRRGKGWGLAPFFSMHKWWNSQEQSFGDGTTWSESVGLQFRYSTGPGGAVFLEAGYEHFNSTGLAEVTLQGLTSQIAYELRFPLDPDYDNQFLFAPGLGYEHLVASVNAPGFPSQSEGAFVPRLRFGYRHMIESNAAIDLSLDAGVANFFQYSKFPFDSNNPTNLLLAANVALVWGL